MKGAFYPHISHIYNSKRFRSNGAILLCFLVLFILLFVFVPTKADAISILGWNILDPNDVAQGILQVAGRLFGFIVGGITWLLNWIGYGLLYISVFVVKAAIEFVFTAGYTPLSNELGAVAVAWGIIRDLANMAMIIVLIVIGAGTMVGFQRIGPRLLAPFIAVAFLINFTPFILGMMIDVSNVLAKFFFDEAFGGANAFISRNPFIENLNTTDDLLFANLADLAATVLNFGIALAFNLLTAFVLFTLSILLIARVLALQLLVILSPIAFVAKILPASQRLFTRWWEQFYQWLILPIPVGLFLWLSLLILLKGSDQCKALPSDNADVQGGISNTFSDFANQLVGGDTFCLTTVLLMSTGAIFLGMMVGFQTSAIGANLIVNQANRARRLVTSRGVSGAKWGARQGGRQAWRGTKWGARVIGEQQIPRTGGRSINSSARVFLRNVGRSLEESQAFGPVGRGVRRAGRAFQAPDARQTARDRSVATDAAERVKNEMENTQNLTPESWETIASNPGNDRTVRTAAGANTKDATTRVAALSNWINTMSGESIDPAASGRVAAILNDPSIDYASKAALLNNINASKNGTEKLENLLGEDPSMRKAMSGLIRNSKNRKDDALKDISTTLPYLQHNTPDKLEEFLKGAPQKDLNAMGDSIVGELSHEDNQSALGALLARQDIQGKQFLLRKLNRANADQLEDKFE